MGGQDGASLQSDSRRSEQHLVERADQVSAAARQDLMLHVVGGHEDKPSDPERTANSVDDEAYFRRQAIEAGENSYSG